ncbi:MAG: large conductance mechanosensitive channel protein MscL [Candidatus Binataceae bacterium]
MPDDENPMEQGLHLYHAFKAGSEAGEKPIGGAMNGFKQFLLRGNVVDMAVGIVVGAAFGTVVTSFVKDLLTPLIAAIVRQPDFSTIAFELNGSKFLIGDFVNAIVSFVIIAAAVYFAVVLPINALVARARRQAPVDPTTKKCPECISEIPIQARKCAFCASALQA